MDWREVKFKLVEQVASFSRFEIFVEGCWLVRAKVIRHHSDALRIRVVLIDEMLDELDPIFGDASILDSHRSPAGERFRRQKHVLVPLRS